MRSFRQTSGWAVALMMVLGPLTLGNDGCEGYQSTGTLGQLCGLDAAACSEGEYCRYAGDLTAEGTGVCTDVPDLGVCAEIYQPVCGLDGVTYGNACIAAAMGASVARDGECVPDDTGCIALWAPVCGDDGVTYGNACEAGVAGVMVVSDGACGGGSACPDPAPLAPNEICADGSIGGPVCTCDAAGCHWELRSCPTQRACGGFAGFACEPGEYCDMGIGQCQVADGLGYCRPQPSVCTGDYAPVCGCDGNTYSNECHAAGLGVGIDHLGACASAVCDPVDCGAPPLSPLPYECLPSDATVSPPECVWTPTCYPTPCAAPPPGCHYEGGDICSCGTLVCDDCALVDCAPPPAGCTTVDDGSCCGSYDCPAPQFCDPAACGPAPEPTVPYVCAVDGLGGCSWIYPYPYPTP